MSDEGVPIDFRVMKDLRPETPKEVKKVTHRNPRASTPLPTEGWKDERVAIFGGAQLRQSSRTMNGFFVSEGINITLMHQDGRSFDSPGEEKVEWILQVPSCWKMSELSG